MALYAYAIELVFFDLRTSESEPTEVQSAKYETNFKFKKPCAMSKILERVLQYEVS